MNIAELISDRRDEGRFLVNRTAMTSREIFALEQERVLDRSWLYLGHEGEVPNAGDYRRRIVAGRPLFFTRDAGGTVNVFANTCTHRGAQVCRHDEGNGATFQCFYHAWTFDGRGQLVGLPDEAGYGHGFHRADYALKSPPRVESYRGFIFVSFDPAIAALQTSLGDAREIIDLTVDSAEVLGGWQIMRGCARYSIKANWKLLVENSYDGYHLPTVHQTYLDYMAWRRELNRKSAAAPKRPTTHAFACRGGHGGMLHEAVGRGIASPSPNWSDEANAAVERVRQANIARFGEERGREMCEVSRHLLVFPNLAFQDTQSGFRLRLIWPVAPDALDVLQWDFVPRDEQPESRAARMENSLAFLGPGGLATPDDVEALESCQRGFAATDVAWSDLSRGMERAPTMNDELQMRAFWRQWHGLMLGHAAVETGDTPNQQPRAVLA